MYNLEPEQNTVPFLHMSEGGCRNVVKMLLKQNEPV
jgi:hypothetical protein